MQTILIILVNTFILSTAQIVSLENLYDNLRDLPVQKRHEPEYICKDSPVDIVLVVDSSRSIIELDFKQQIDFLVEFVTLFDINPNKVRFAAISFGETVIRQGAFSFNKYNSTAEAQWGLRRIKYQGDKFGGQTNTALVLKYVRERYFPRARPEARKLCIVLTDGRSTDPRKTHEEAALLKSKDVTMVAIGIGKRISLEELKGIASSSELVFTVDKHYLLETIQKKLILNICKDVVFVTKEPPLQKDQDVKIVTTELPEKKYIVTTKEPIIEQEDQNKLKNTTKGCNGPLDINVVFNPSVVGTQRIIAFIEQTITSKALANDDVRVGIITVPAPVIDGFRLNRYQTKNKITSHFDGYKANLMAPQIKDLRREAFLPINGGRANARKIGVIFLRGKLDDVIMTIVEATLGQADGIEMYVIALGDLDGPVIISHIATDSNHVLRSTNTIDVLGLICKT